MHATMAPQCYVLFTDLDATAPNDQHSQFHKQAFFFGYVKSCGNNAIPLYHWQKCFLKISTLKRAAIYIEKKRA